MRYFLYRFLFFILTVVALCLEVDAQSDIVIVKTGAAKTLLDVSGITVSGGAAGGMFMRTFKNDLIRSGWFDVSGAGRAVLFVRGNFIQTGHKAVFNCEVVNKASAQVLFSRSFHADNKYVRRLAHNAADAIVEAIKKVPGIASTRIAMVGAHGARKDVYMCDADGGNMKRLTSKGAVCLSPNWWPDGRSLVYTSFHKGFPDTYKLDLRTHRRSRISGFSGINTGASISPDGRRVALTLSKDGNPELYIMDLHSSRLFRLTRTIHAAEASPSWSPDGNMIVYVSDSPGTPQLYIISSRGGKSRRISFRGVENVAPDWSKDGRIAYSSRRSGRYHICIYDAADGQSTELTKDYIDYEAPSWAPDSRHIVCVRTVNYKSDLYILDTMGDSPVRLTNISGDWYSPAWSSR